MQASAKYRRHSAPALTLVAVIAITFCGCPGSNLFSGRLLILNATGNEMTSLAVIVDEEEIPLTNTADGQAWIKKVRVYRRLAFRWRDEQGTEHGASEPLEDFVPKN